MSATDGEIGFCVCDTTIKRECVYHGILHAPTRTTLRRIWPVASDVVDAESVGRPTVNILLGRYQELRTAEIRAKHLLEIIKRARRYSAEGASASVLDLVLSHSEDEK